MCARGMTGPGELFGDGVTTFLPKLLCDSTFVPCPKSLGPKSAG